MAARQWTENEMMEVDASEMATPVVNSFGAIVSRSFISCH